MSTATKTAKKQPTKSQPVSRLIEPTVKVNGSLIDADLTGYCPFRVDVLVPKSARENLKRLALTLDVSEAKLTDGTLVQNKVSKAVAWLIEKFSDEIEKSESGKSGK